MSKSVQYSVELLDSPGNVARLKTIRDNAMGLDRDFKRIGESFGSSIEAGISRAEIALNRFNLASQKSYQAVGVSSRFGEAGTQATYSPQQQLGPRLQGRVGDGPKSHGPSIPDYPRQLEAIGKLPLELANKFSGVDDDLRDRKRSRDTGGQDEKLVFGKPSRETLESEAAIRRLTDAERRELAAVRELGAGVRTTAGDEAKRARDMARGREIIEANRSAHDKLNRSLAEARRLYKAGAIDAATYQKHASELRSNSGVPGFLPSKAGSSVSRGVAGVAAGFTAISIAKDAIETNAKAERAQATMEAFTGSASKASGMLSDIRKLSSEAGISFGALNEGASTLLGYGVTAEKTSKKLRQFAEISRGDSERFRSLALAFGQTTAAGKLMGQEVLQLVNAGFNPLAEISRTTGVDMSVLRKQMEAGGISVNAVSKAFDSATEAGGRFDGLMEKIGETSSGSIGKLKSTWEQFLDSLGRTAPVKEVSNELTKGLETATTYLSPHEEAVQRRMDYAKSTGKSTVIDSMVQGGLAQSAAVNNSLDERLAKHKKTIDAVDEYNRKQKQTTKLAAELNNVGMQAGGAEVAYQAALSKASATLEDMTGEQRKLVESVKSEADLREKLNDKSITAAEKRLSVAEKERDLHRTAEEKLENAATKFAGLSQEDKTATLNAKRVADKGGKLNKRQLDLLGNVSLAGESDIVKQQQLAEAKKSGFFDNFGSVERSQIRDSKVRQRELSEIQSQAFMVGNAPTAKEREMQSRMLDQRQGRLEDKQTDAANFKLRPSEADRNFSQQREQIRVEVEGRRELKVTLASDAESERAAIIAQVTKLWGDKEANITKLVADEFKKQQAKVFATSQSASMQRRNQSN